MFGRLLFLIKYLLFWIKYIFDRKNISRIKIDINKEVIVLGNGPSLNESFSKHRTFFDNKYSIAVNSFVTSNLFEQIKPEFYIITDSAFWTEQKTDNNDKKYVKINENRLKNVRNDFINNMINKVKWDMTLFVPLQGKLSDGLKELEKNKHIKICYYVMNPINCKNKTLRHFLYKHNFGMPIAQTVLIPALFLALNMKFKKIYLLGGDHSWHEDYHVDKNNILYTKDKHFYDEGEPKLIPMVSDGKKSTKIHEEWLSLSIAFRGHVFLEEYAKFLGAKIYNASEKSYIDAYERYKR